jgi:hypothetical protein
VATVQEDRQWVIEQYDYLFGRKPTTEELDQRVYSLQHGMSRQDFMRIVETWNADEEVTRTFHSTLGRDPSPDERAKYVAAFENGTLNRVTFRNNLAGTAEALLREPIDLNAGPTGDQEDAKNYLNDVLRNYGLDTLGEWAWEQIQAGHTPARVIQELRQRDEYKQRFVGMAERQSRGLPAISEAEYIAWERSARQMMQTAGLPADFYDRPDDFGRFIGRDVSLQELSERVNDGFRQAMAAGDEVRDELQRLYGVGASQLAAFFLDPDRALPVIERQFAASQISGAAQRTTYGGLSQTEAERLASLGITDQQANSGFGTLVEMSELFADLPGGNAGTIGRDEQIGAAFEGNAAAQQAIARKGQERVSESSGAQAFQIGQGGVVGLSRERR